MCFIVKYIINSIFLCLLLFFSGCSYATGNIHPDGSVSFTVFRPYLEKHKIQVEYNPATKELHIAVDTEVEHLNLKELGAAIGAGVGAAAKAGLVP